jgi:broad specificity phosphatase PhoE
VDLVSGPNNFNGPTRPVDFIRHGSTALNAGADKDKIRGWVDVPLDDRGIREAEKIGRDLALLKTKPRVIFSSDLQRAVKTAHIISQSAGIPLAQPVHGLRPWNLGHFQGVESARIAPQMKMFVNNPRQRVPGGESFNEFGTRFISTLRGLMAKTQFRMGIISHHRNERYLSAMEKADWKGFDKTEFAKHGSPTGVMVTFDIPYVPSQQQQGLQRRGQLQTRPRGL